LRDVKCQWLSGEFSSECLFSFDWHDWCNWCPFYDRNCLQLPQESLFNLFVEFIKI